MPDARGTRQRLVRPGGALAALVLVGAGWTLVQGETSSFPAQRDAAPGDQTSARAVALPTPRKAPAVPGAPRRITVPTLAIDAPVDPVRTLDRTLVPPTDPRRIGWWADGAQPGDRTGTALLTGHTVHTGGGAFDDLEDLVAGDRVEVSTTRGAAAFEVTSVQTLSSEEVATRHRELFDQDGPARLVLVTCEDWDGQAYQSSVIITAAPVAATS